ncbi:MAG: endonuclease V [candidate division WOR-3 bacterium]
MNKGIRLDHLINQQNLVARRVRIVGYKKVVKHIAGIDVSAKNNMLFCCIALFNFPELKDKEFAYAYKNGVFPYIPNFLAFRELPVILKAYKNLTIEPDLILVDGQGIAHPRYCGVATHLGVILNKPTIGCAKSHLFGEFTMPGKNRGDFSPIKRHNKKIGIVLRTKDNVKPLFVSPGNLVNLKDCRKYVLATTLGYRIPEPIRQAHIRANKYALGKVLKL